MNRALKWLLRHPPCSANDLAAGKKTLTKYTRLFSRIPRHALRNSSRLSNYFGYPGKYPCYRTSSSLLSVQQSALKSVPFSRPRSPSPTKLCPTIRSQEVFHALPLQSFLGLLQPPLPIHSAKHRPQLLSFHLQAEHTSIACGRTGRRTRWCMALLMLRRPPRFLLRSRPQSPLLFLRVSRFHLNQVVPPSGHEHPCRHRLSRREAILRPDRPAVLLAGVFAVTSSAVWSCAREESQVRRFSVDGTPPPAATLARQDHVQTVQDLLLFLAMSRSTLADEWGSSTHWPRQTDGRRCVWRERSLRHGLWLRYPRALGRLRFYTPSSFPSCSPDASRRLRACLTNH